ncbi:MAG: ACT domain-containing protein [Lachnospiraceae bacterium]
MLENFLIVHKQILPEYYPRVVEARNMLEENPNLSVSDVVKKVGISRSTYYKYKDYIFLPEDGTFGQRKAVLYMVLSHKAGVLSSVLNALSGFGASVLTISQSIPIGNKASVSISLDISSLSCSMESMMADLKRVNGVKSLQLSSID